MRPSIFIKTLIFLIILLFVDYQSFAQSQGAPESMNYQAVIRDGSGNLVVSQTVSLRIKILQGSASGSTVYVETFAPTTNAYGSIAIQIGTGSVITGTFNTIDWGANSYFVETAVDISGGNTYTVISTTQFVSVPYALYAKNAGLDSTAIQAMIDASSGISSGNGGKSFAFPEGFVGTPITYSIDASGNYTLPSGKNLYIINVYGNTSHYLEINGLQINWYSTNSSTDKTISLPIIASAGDVIGGSNAVFNGILLDKSSDLNVITYSINSSGNYTVPSGKNLFITNVNGNTSHYLEINGLQINWYNTNSSSGKTLSLPIIATAGDVISGSNAVFNGYLVDTDYFQSSSSSGSSSSVSNANTFNYLSDGF